MSLRASAGPRSTIDRGLSEVATDGGRLDTEFSRNRGIERKHNITGAESRLQKKRRLEVKTSFELPR